MKLIIIKLKHQKKTKKHQNQILEEAPKTPGFDFYYVPKLVSHKIWVVENSKDFHAVSVLCE